MCVLLGRGFLLGLDLFRLFFSRHFVKKHDWADNIPRHTKRMSGVLRTTHVVSTIIEISIHQVSSLHSFIGCQVCVWSCRLGSAIGVCRFGHMQFQDVSSV